MDEIVEITGEGLWEKREAVFQNRESILAKLDRDDISEDKRKCLDYQLSCVQKALYKIDAEIDAKIKAYYHL